MNSQTCVEDKNVDVVHLGERTVYLVGTAHVSKQSAELVERCIRDLTPDRVCIELCAPRFESLRNPDRWKETNIVEIIRSGRWHVLLVQLALSGFQRRLASRLEISPGEEMLRAIEVSQLLGIPLELIDREVRITLKRAWTNAGFWSLVRLFASLFTSLFSKIEIDEEEIEALKEADALTAMMREFGEFLPGVKTALIDERDQYMAEKIRRQATGKTIAIVGAGHVPGIKKYITEARELEPLETIPPPSRSMLLLTWGIPILVLGLILYGLLTASVETSQSMIISWVLVNGSLSALGALIALAHPLTIVIAFLAAPLTSLNPAVAAGWVAGLVEAFLRKPRVRDLELLADDSTSVKGFWSNRVTRILLVMLLTNIGSSLGTLIGVGFIASLLAGS